MKKSLYILLTLVLLLSILTGCEHFVPGGGQVDRPALTPVDDPADDPEDPTVDEYGFTLFPEGNYLADPKFDTDEYLPDYDVDLSMFDRSTSSYSTICSTEDSIFSCDYQFGPNFNHLILYTDKAMGQTLPLCGKPECTHDNDSCNAWVGNQAMGLRVYDGKLIWVDNTQVKRMELDGTNREIVTSLNWRPGFDFNNYDYFFHRGYIYSTGVARSIVKDGEACYAFRVYAKALDGGESLTILDLTKKGNGGNIDTNCWAVPAGNDLIIMFTWYEDAPEGSDRTFDKYTEIYRWSSKTRKAEQLYSAVNSPWDIDIYNGYPQVIPSDGIYFVSAKYTLPANTPNGQWSSKVLFKYQLIRFSFEAKDFEEISHFQLEGGSEPMLTRDHIILFGPPLSEDGRMLVYDYDWDLVYQSEPLGEVYHVYSYLGEDGDYFYLSTVGNDDPEFFLAVSLNGGENLTIRQ